MRLKRTGTMLAVAGALVALYQFQSRGDVGSFYKVAGANCTRKWRKHKTLGVNVGAGTNACALRSSVVADSSDPGPDQEVSASVNLAAATPAKLRKKIYLGVAVRQSDTTRYELRLYPQIRKWQLVRDARGSVKPKVIAGGSGKFIRQGAGVRNDLLLRAFDYGTSGVTLLAKVNKKKVISQRDTGSGQPNGRRNVLTVGAKGKASANRAVAVFDNVAIRVPTPF
jgi:hypothetical protein